MSENKRIPSIGIKVNWNEHEQLKEQNAELIKALGFYADAAQWVTTKPTYTSNHASIIYNDAEDIPTGPVLIPTGGKLARSVLAKWGIK